MSDQLSQSILDQIRLTVRTAVKSAFKEVIEQIQMQSQNDESIKGEDFLSAEQTAKFLKIKLNTVYSKCEKGELPFYRVGKRRLLFSKVELIAYINYRRANQKLIIDSGINIMNK